MASAPKQPPLKRSEATTHQCLDQIGLKLQMQRFSISRKREHLNLASIRIRLSPFRFFAERLDSLPGKAQFNQTAGSVAICCSASYCKSRNLRFKIPFHLDSSGRRRYISSSGKCIPISLPYDLLDLTFRILKHGFGPSSSIRPGFIYALLPLALQYAFPIDESHVFCRITSIFLCRTVYSVCWVSIKLQFLVSSAINGIL